MVNKTPHNEKTIGVGEITKEVIKRPYADATRYRPGQRVDIAHYALSNDKTIAYYRVANTLDWLSEDTIKPNVELFTLVAAKKIAPATEININNKKPFTSISSETKKDNSEISGLKKTKQQTVLSFTKKKITRNSKTNKGKTGMDKSQLRIALNSFTPGQVVEFNFVGGQIEFNGRNYKSGTFTVLTVRNGRGKGGSRLVELRPGKSTRPASDEWRLITGTPDSNRILNITAGDTKYGYNTEAEMPMSFDRNAGSAAKLKETFKRFLDAEGQYMISIKSTQPVFNGKFTINRAQLLRGRSGQIAAELQRVGTEEVTQFWTYKHSGVIQTITFIGEKGASEVIFSE